MPALQLLTMSYLLGPVLLGRAPVGFPSAFRMLQAVRPWAMVEVLMLGVLVSMVKLANLATLMPGIALWAFGALMLVMAAIAAVFDPRELWARLSVSR
jgi:paraquat-inducible protein A